MGDWLTQILLGLVAVGFFSDLAKGFFQKKKLNSEASLNDASAVQVIVGSATAMLKPLTERLEEAEAEVNRARDEAKMLRVELQQARGEVQRYANQLNESTNQLAQATAENKRVTTENRRLRAMLAGGPT